MPSPCTYPNWQCTSSESIGDGFQKVKLLRKGNLFLSFTLCFSHRSSYFTRTPITTASTVQTSSSLHPCFPSLKLPFQVIPCPCCIGTYKSDLRVKSHIHMHDRVSEALSTSQDCN
jgi:hypothetical protein